MPASAFQLVSLRVGNSYRGVYDPCLDRRVPPWRDAPPCRWRAVPEPHHQYNLTYLREQIAGYLDPVDIPVVAVIQSLGSAACFAVSSIVQQQAAREQPDSLSLRPGLLTRLMRSGRWLAGVGCDIGGWLLQFFALRSASLALVIPLSVVGLPMSIVGAAFADRRRPTRGEWSSSLLIMLGLAAFIAAARPGPPDPHASPRAWALLGVATVVCVGGPILLAGRTPRRRAIMLGISTGILYGVTSAVTERTGYVLNHGILHALTTWAPYTLAVGAIVGLLLNQSAYQAGELRWSLPVFTVLEPVVAIIIGQVVLSEHISSGVGARTGQVAGLVAMTVGVFWLVHVSVPEGDAHRSGAPPPAGSDQRQSAVPSGRKEGANPPSALTIYVGHTLAGRPSGDERCADVADHMGRLTTQHVKMVT